MTTVASARSGDDAPIVHDGAQLAVLSHRFQAIVRQMQNTLARSARSGVLAAARDFSCCILTAEGAVLMTGQSPPIHVMGGPDLQAKALAQFYPRMKAGDAFMHNSPYHGNTHAADHTIMVPVVDADGVHRFTVVAKGHQADCGDSIPTTYMVSARDVYEEGALIFPVVRVQEDYQDLDDIIRMCRMRIRVPEQWHGDFLALMGSARIGEREVLDLGAEIGWDSLEAFCRQWLDYSEARTEAAIRALPAGRVVTETRHDPFPGVPEGIPIRAVVEVKPDEGIIDVDLTDNIDCVPCGLNLSEATSRTAAMIGVFNSIDHTVPHNQGSFRRIKVHLRENCVVGIARFPASTSAATTNLADRLGNIVQRAIAEIGYGFGLAEAGTGMSPTEAVISGSDPRHDGQPFVNQLFTGPNGGPGGPQADGWLTMDDLLSGGQVLVDSIEVAELKHPILVQRRSLIPDSEGAGRHRGAPGIAVEYGPVGCRIEAIYANDGTITPMMGAAGGGAGARASQAKRLADGEIQAIGPVGPVLVDDGETLVSCTSGGGGYGSPLDREPALVAHDVAEGWITRERALAVYGVALDDRGVPNEATTMDARARLRSEQVVTA
jgi:N-methylhydantoinase B